MKDYYQLPKYYPTGFHMPIFSFHDIPSQENSSSNSEIQDNSGGVNESSNRKINSACLSDNQEKKLSNNKWPAIDIIEYNNKYLVEIEVPGFQKKDISLDFDSSSGVLTVQGIWLENIIKSPDMVVVEDEENSDTESIANSSIIIKTNSGVMEGTAKKILAERKSKRNFKRSFRIKERVDSENITATLNDGILILNIPKVKNEKKHNIIIS